MATAEGLELADLPVWPRAAHTQATSKQDKAIAGARYRDVVKARKGVPMKIDTEVRRVTKPGANLFLELGFPPAEAKRLHALSRKHINDTRRLKRQLMDELSAWIAQHRLKQSEAAAILMVSRPRVFDVMNKGRPSSASTRS